MAFSIQGFSDLAKSASGYCPPAEAVGVAAVVAGRVMDSSGLRKLGALVTIGGLAWRAVSYVTSKNAPQPAVAANVPAQEEQPGQPGAAAAAIQPQNPAEPRSVSLKRQADEMTKIYLQFQEKGVPEANFYAGLVENLTRQAGLEELKERQAAMGPLPPESVRYRSQAAEMAGKLKRLIETQNDEDGTTVDKYLDSIKKCVQCIEQAEAKEKAASAAPVVEIKENRVEAQPALVRLAEQQPPVQYQYPASAPPLPPRPPHLLQQGPRQLSPEGYPILPPVRSVAAAAAANGGFH